ncbi:MAG: single-stranded-DNA-specific exonuclease RecJ [Fimbriimonadaceae bacterium]|nr:single-stranded-DNA-specific exonuclease RecJ [Chitinophagales bacterium]
MEKRWVIKSAEEEKISALQKELRIHPVLCKLLVQRGITDFNSAKVFFRPKLSDLHDPFLMKTMSIAIERIEKAIASNEKILIYGDYDVDGTTSVALVYSFFKNIYNNLDFYIPNRYTEGYGISLKGIDYAKENNCALVIALDCGIKANDKMEYANKLGIDFIICDHHIPGEEIPKANAVLDPHQADCSYPYKELSGCGIGFKLIQAFAQKNNFPFETITQYLDLVVISIASDIVPITGENRVLAYYGLQILNNNPRKGIKALIEVSALQPPLNITNIVFGLGPRINAAGRLDDAKNAVLMLLSDTHAIAKDNADILQDKNNDRREIDKKITGEALQILQNDPDEKNKVTNVLFNENWHKGVVGIVASRVIDQYYKPTILLTLSNGMIVGSARSVKNFDIYEAIKECSDLLDQFGGHMYAAGLSLIPENLEAFKQKFDAVVRKRILPEQRIPEVEIDAEIKLGDIRIEFFNILKQFAPFGPQNMSPVFLSKNIISNGKTKIVGDGHLKLGMKDENLFHADGIAFQKGAYYEDLLAGKKFDVCYAIEENYFNGMEKLQLNVKEIKMS